MSVMGHGDLPLCAPTHGELISRRVALERTPGQVDLDSLGIGELLSFADRYGIPHTARLVLDAYQGRPVALLEW